MPPFVRVCVGVFAITCVAVDGLCVGGITWGQAVIGWVLSHPNHSPHSHPMTPRRQKILAHTHTWTQISSHPTPCFINASPAFTVFPYPPASFSQCFPSCLVCVFLLSFQCNMSTHGQRGECWCVDPLTGVQISETPKVRGDPNCNQFQEVHRAMPTAEASH